MDLLLLSNSTNHGRRMFAHAAEAFAEVAAGSTVTFIPFALAEWDDYAYRAEAAFGAVRGRRWSRPTGPPTRPGPSSRPTS